MSLTLFKIVGSKKLKLSSPFPFAFPWRLLLLAVGYTFFPIIRTSFNPTSHKQTQHLLKYIPYSLSFSKLSIMKELASQASNTFFISHSFFNSVTLYSSTLLKLLPLKTPTPTQIPNSGTFLLTFCLTWHGCNPQTQASWSSFLPCLPGQHSSGSSPITNGYSSVPLSHLTCLSHASVPQTSTPASAFFSSTHLFVFLSTLLVSTMTYGTRFLFLRWT